MLRDVRDAADDKLTQYFGQDYIENDSQLPFVVHYIFQVARGTHSVGEATKLQYNVRSAMMVKIAEVCTQEVHQSRRPRGI